MSASVIRAKPHGRMCFTEELDGLLAARVHKGMRVQSPLNTLPAPMDVNQGNLVEPTCSEKESAQAAFSGPNLLGTELNGCGYQSRGFCCITNPTFEQDIWIIKSSGPTHRRQYAWNCQIRALKCVLRPLGCGSSMFTCLLHMSLDPMAT